MTSIPSNLTLIREDFRNPRSLSAIKADMVAAPTDYVMVVGLDDTVDVQGALTEGVHYLATHVGTRRAVRYFRPVLPYNAVLLTQFNYLGSPILHQDLVPLFPEAAIEPWHTVMLRAQSAGASFGLVAGEYGIVEPWPRPALSGAYTHYRTSFDPEAVMAAVPGIQVDEINHRPYYSLKQPRLGSVKAYCRDCSPGFVGGLVGLNVKVEAVPTFNLDRIKTSDAEYVAWFDGIAEGVDHETLSQLQLALEFPGVKTASPKIVGEFSPTTYAMPPFWLDSGIYAGFSPDAWMSRTGELGLTAPVSGHTNSHAILRKVP